MRSSFKAMPASRTQPQSLHPSPVHLAGHTMRPRPASCTPQPVHRTLAPARDARGAASSPLRSSTYSNCGQPLLSRPMFSTKYRKTIVVRSLTTSAKEKPSCKLTSKVTRAKPAKPQNPHIFHRKRATRHMIFPVPKVRRVTNAQSGIGGTPAAEPWGAYLITR